LSKRAFPDRQLVLFFLAQIVALTAVLPAAAQDDVTTQNASSAVDGGWITGPASNPLSYLNGPAYRTFGSTLPYDFPDFHPVYTGDNHLPHWIRFESEERFRSERYHGGSFRLGNNDDYLLNRFRLQVDLQPNSWFKLVSQVQDARPFFENAPIGPPNENRWDLKLAFAQFGDPEKHWINVRVGRQLINYNNTLIANSEWRNQGRSYDAVVTNLHHGPLRLGVFAASAVVPLASGISHHQEGNNIYGVYGKIDKLIPHASVEPFVLWRVQPNIVLKPTASKATGKEDLKAYGMRLKGKVKGNLDYSLELVDEGGKTGSDVIRAWGLTGGVAYEFASAPGRPRLFGQYDLASGDDNPADGTRRTFDAIYPTAHDRFGILDQFGWQNIRSFRGGGTVTPHRRWTVTAQYLDFRLACANDAAYNSSGGVIAYDNGKFGSHIGEEADVYSWYELNRHMNIGAGYGWFGAGRFLAHSTTSNMYSGSYVAINFKDNGRAPAELH
jgi:hypothetical protein